MFYFVHYFMRSSITHHFINRYIYTTVRKFYMYKSKISKNKYFSSKDLLKINDHYFYCGIKKNKNDDIIKNCQSNASFIKLNLYLMKLDKISSLTFLLSLL